jgi:hypothetical protein
MAWKKSALKHPQTFSCAFPEFMDMLLVRLLYALERKGLAFRFRCPKIFLKFGKSSLLPQPIARLPVFGGDGGL